MNCCDIKDITRYYECACRSPEHTLKFIYDPIEKELYTEIFLSNYRSRLKTIWTAIKYVFGYKCKFGHWDCFIFTDIEIKDLKNLLEKTIDENNR